MARPSVLSALSIGQINAELRRRQKKVATLLRRRQRLVNAIAAMDNKIVEAGGSAGRAMKAASGGRRRATNNVTLHEALHAVMKGKDSVGIGEAADAVLKAGYQTHSKTFKVQVAQMFAKHTKLFKKVGRGQYAAK